MKTFRDRLIEAPIEYLEKEIARQKAEIEILNRDLEIMQKVLADKKQNLKIDNAIQI